MSNAQPMSAVRREIAYVMQNGGDDSPYKPLTPAQQRRARQKNNRRLAVRPDKAAQSGKVAIKPRHPWIVGGTWVDPFRTIKVQPHTFGRGDQ